MLYTLNPVGPDMGPTECENQQMTQVGKELKNHDHFC